MATSVKEHPKQHPNGSSASAQARHNRVKKYAPGRNPATLANLMRGPAPSRDGPLTDEGGATDLYAAMNAVASQHPKKDRGQFERNCRKWLRKDGRGFLMKLADLAKARLAAKRRRPKQKPAWKEDETLEDDEDRQMEELFGKRKGTDDDEVLEMPPEGYRRKE